jgi:enamine deaminase RidA (YjgF/YER057c/UK114 family)
MLKKVIKKIPHIKYTEYYVTVNWKNLKRDELIKILDDLCAKAINIISVTYAGNLENFETVSDLFGPYPTTALGDSPSKRKSGDGGICIYGIQGREIQTEYIKVKKKIIGAFFFLPQKWKGLYVTNPHDSKRDSLRSFENETSRSYADLEKIMAKYGFLSRDAYRFWIYMKNIRENYAAFNSVRDRYFKKNGIIDYPASTGIEADLAENHRISIGLEALKSIDSKDIAIQSLTSDLQCEASTYGPKFSRGEVVHFKNDRLKKIYVSGTSSVCKNGSSAQTNDCAKNIDYVISCVNHILANSGAGLEDIVMSHIYSKNDKVQRIFEKIYLNKEWTFPYNLLKTNICRENLIFEMECIAADSKKKVH